MKLLLDTHAALWWLADDERIGEQVSRHLTDDTNQVLISAVVVWEVAIKRSLGKLDAPEDLAPTLPGRRSSAAADHARARSCGGEAALAPSRSV